MQNRPGPGVHRGDDVGSVCRGGETRCYTPGMRKYVLSAHAETVIAARSIPIAWVERVLTSPEKNEPDKGDPQVTHALGRIPEHGGRVLRVVYNGVIEPVTIVTVYFDRTQRNKL